ncbi:DUF6747 family protein [Galbibacter sp. PAP.153]|uniref:DUF6747 family protein n=1 Tax=Galbibacter sp. PAP.153 TaxID=3104623 RepID=UPI003008D047
MTTFLLLKQLYTNSFADLKNEYLATVLKALTWLCAFTLGVVIYAFFYRLFTGFPI